MCSERSIPTFNLKKDELLQSLLLYNLSKSPMIATTTVRETRWWKDINDAGWMHFTLLHLHQINKGISIW